MKRYSDFSDTDTKDLPFTKYRIIVPTIKDKTELESAFEHIHYSDVDTDNIAVNQLIHEYLTPEITGSPETKNNIVVNENLFDAISNDVNLNVSKNALYEQGHIVMNNINALKVIDDIDEEHYQILMNSFMTFVGYMNLKLNNGEGI